MNTYLISVIGFSVNINHSEIARVAGGKNVYKLQLEMFVRNAACTKQKMGECFIEICKSLQYANNLLKIAQSTSSRLKRASIID